MHNTNLRRKTIIFLLKVRAVIILVEHRGLEPLTPTLPVWCAPNCANAPKMVEMAVIARWASALTDTPRLKTVHRTVFLTAVSITVLLFRKEYLRASFSLFYGGDGGNRNRVLKHILKAFFVWSLLFKLSPHKTTANSLFATVGPYTWWKPSHSFIHVRH